MRAGEFPNGARVLRAKIDMASGNINLRDPVLYRILHADHPRTGDNWCIYPSYDFAHGQSDAIEGITHSICTLEFEDHRPLYDWLLDKLPVPSQPHQYEFARLNLTYTRAVEARADRTGARRPCRRLGRSAHADALPGCAGAACRRRRSANSSSASAWRKANSVVDVGMLEFCIREVLNTHGAAAHGGAAAAEGGDRELSGRRRARSSRRVNHPDDPGRRHAPRSRSAASSTSSATISWRIRRRSSSGCRPAREVRLRYAYFITCREVVKDAAGEVVELRCTYDPATKGGNAPDGRKVQGDACTGWRPRDAVPAEVRLYNPLFTKPDPGRRQFRRRPQSAFAGNADRRPGRAGAGGRPIRTRRCSSSGRAISAATRIPPPGAPVFNRTVGLRDTWAKVQAAG